MTVTIRNLNDEIDGKVCEAVLARMGGARPAVLIAHD